MVQFPATAPPGLLPDQLPGVRPAFGPPGLVRSEALGVPNCERQFANDALDKFEKKKQAPGWQKTAFLAGFWSIFLSSAQLKDDHM